MSVLDRFGTNMQPSMSSTYKSISSQQESSYKNYKLAEIQRLSDQLRLQQLNFNYMYYSQTVSLYQSYVAYINTLKIALKQSQKTISYLQLYVSKLSNQRPYEQQQLSVYYYYPDDYSMLQLQAENYQMRQKLERLSLDYQAITDKNDLLKQYLRYLSKLQTENKANISISESMLYNNSVNEVLYNEVVQLRRETQEQKEEINALYQLGLMQTSNQLRSSKILPTNMQTFCNQISEYLQEIADGIEEPRIQIDYIQQAVKLVLLNIADVCGRLFTNEYENWRIGVREISDSCEYLIDYLGGI